MRGIYRKGRDVCHGSQILLRWTEGKALNLMSPSHLNLVSLQLGLSPQSAEPAGDSRDRGKDEDLRPQSEGLAGKGAPEQGRKPTLCECTF